MKTMERFLVVISGMLLVLLGAGLLVHTSTKLGPSVFLLAGMVLCLERPVAQKKMEE